MAGHRNTTVTVGAFGSLTARTNPIFNVLQVILVVTVMATLHLAMVVHELNLKLSHRAAARKPVRPQHAPA